MYNLKHVFFFMLLVFVCACLPSKQVDAHKILLNNEINNLKINDSIVLGSKVFEYMQFSNSIDTITGYWLCDSSGIYFLSLAYFNANCSIPVTMCKFINDDNSGGVINTNCYDSLNIKISEFQAYYNFIGVNIIGADTTYKFAHYMHVKSLLGNTTMGSYDSIPSFSMKRQFIYSKTKGTISVVTTKNNCEGCYFPYDRFIRNN
ncbi:MAG: hypothetical protein WAT43_13435 [Chitinophagales bacterium]